MHFEKYRGTFLKRLGKGFPRIDKKNRKLLWIHAVSLGETNAIIPLIKQLKSLSEPPLILLSTTTKTGYALGSEKALADYHVYLPFDFSYVIQPIMKQLSPDMVILSETDFWYHFQKSAKENGAQVVVVNGKLSERSLRRFLKFPYLSQCFFSSIDHFFIQNDLYATRFSQLGLPKFKLTVTGNLKLDNEIEIEDTDALKKKLGLTSQLILTVASTHPPEEQLFLKAYKKLIQEFPQLKLLIVPRHPERFNDVATLLQKEGMSFSRWSCNGRLDSDAILLVDKMGVLKKCYQISDLAFVGGSFNKKVGGHNILEPAFYGKPVIFGPYMHSQLDFVNLVHAYNAGIQVSHATLIPILKMLFSDASLRNTMGDNGRKMISASQGALNKTFQALLLLLRKHNL